MSSNFLTAEKTIAAGEFTQFGRGGYFRLYSSTGEVRVVFKDAKGKTLGAGSFESGEWSQFDFEQVFIYNDGGSAVTVKVRVSPYASGSDSVTLLNGTEAAPLYVREPWQKTMARNTSFHSVGNGKYTGIWLPPSATKDIRCLSVSIFGAGQFDVGFAASTAAGIASEGGWTSAPLAYAELATVSTDTASVKENATAAASPIMAGATMSGPAMMGQIWQLPQKTFLPAGSSYGVVLVFKNVTGVAAKLGLSLTCEEL